MDPKALLEDFSDYLAPKLDTYEQAIYLYALRHSRLQGHPEVVIPFKSARRKMAIGIGEKGKPMAESTCYEKLRSLQEKGCLEVLTTERAGTRLRVKLPAEIPDLIPRAEPARELSIDELDFFTEPKLRLSVLDREGRRCFYCLRTISASNYVIEHVESRPTGGNGYWNVVAACRNCNNRKGASTAEDFLRMLYREALLSAEDFADRAKTLDALRRRELKPRLPGDHA